MVDGVQRRILSSEFLQKLVISLIKRFNLPAYYLTRLFQIPYHQYIFKAGTQREREAFYLLSQKTYSPSYFKRQDLFEELEASDGGDITLPQISQETGFMVCAPQNWAVLDEAISEAIEVFQNPIPANREEDSLAGVSRPNRSYTSALVKLAMSPPILKVVSDYFGYLPILYRLNALYSRNDIIYENSSQFFHLDPEDFRQVKIFLYLNDINEEAGPFCLLNAQASREVSQKLNYRKGRLKDEEVFAIAGRQNFFELTGKAGTLIFVDTSQCYHFGSRPGSQPRKVIMIQYISPFAASFGLGEKFLKTPLGNLGLSDFSEFQEYLLGLKR